MTFTVIGHSVSPTNLYGTSAGTLWFTVTDRLVPVVNPARSIITGLRGTRTFRLEALPRVRLVDSSSLLTAGLLELTQIPVGGVICSTDRLDVGRTALDTLTVRFILPQNAMAMEWTKVDITWSCLTEKVSVQQNHNNGQRTPE